MRILFTVWSFPGHINPTVAFARGLAARGHRIAFSTGERARAIVEKQGFDFLPLRFLDEEKVYARVLSPLARPVLSRTAVLKEWLIATLPDQVKDQEKALSEWKPDVVICDVTMWGVPLVLRETKGAAVVICSFAPGCMIPSPQSPPWGLGLPSPRTWHTRLMAKTIGWLTERTVAGFRQAANEIRARYDLPPLAVPIHKYLAGMPLYLVPSVPELDFDRSDIPQNVHYIGPLIWNETKRVEPPAWLAALPHTRPWVHVTEGTMHVYKPFLLEAAARGLANLPMDVIMTAGGDRDLAASGLDNLAPNVRLESWIPHTELFRNTDVVITTGGAGTLVTALAAGIPLLIVPTEWDKADNAQRVVEAGAAIRISPSRCTPARLRKAVELLLTDKKYRENAQRLGRILKNLDGPARAAELVEKTFARTTGVAW